MKTTIKALIDGLADKSLTFGCRVYCESLNKTFLITSGRGSTGGREHNMVIYPARRGGNNRYCLLALGFKGDDTRLRIKGDRSARPKLTVIGHPILIGDIMQRIFRQAVDKFMKEKAPNDHFKKNVEKLTECWAAVLPNAEVLTKTILDKSLQEIYEKAEWECQSKRYHTFGELCEDCDKIKVPKQPEIRSLFTFLISLNLTKTNE